MEINIILTIILMISTFLYSIKKDFKVSNYIIYFLTFVSFVISLNSGEFKEFLLISFINISAYLYFSNFRDYSRGCIAFIFSLFFFSYYRDIDNILNLTFALTSLVVFSCLLLSDKLVRNNLSFKIVLLNLLVIISLPVLHIFSYEVLSINELEIVSQNTSYLYLGVVLSIGLLFILHLFINKVFQKGDSVLQVQLSLLVLLLLRLVYSKIGTIVSIEFDIMVFGYSLFCALLVLYIVFSSKKEDIRNSYICLFLLSNFLISFYVEKAIYLVPISLLIPFASSFTKFKLPLITTRLLFFIVNGLAFFFVIFNNYSSRLGLYPTLSIGILIGSILLLGVEYLNCFKLEENITKA